MSLDRFRKHKATPDYTYLTLVAMLVLFGLVMIASASVVVSAETYHQNYAFVSKQAVAAGIGLAGMIIASRIPYLQWKRLAPPIMIMGFVLLLIVFLPGLGKEAKGAARWISIGSFHLQPSEIMKLAYILYLAAWIERRGKQIQDFSTGFLPFILLLAPIIIVLMAQRDLGTLLVILGISAAMFFVSGASYGQIGLGLAGGVALIAILIAIAPYRMERLQTFLNPSADKLGAGYHINQAALAIGSGGLWGKGFGQSLQKYLYLPEPHTDSIFAVTVEELGFVRSLVIIAVIGLLAYRGYQIAMRAGDDFGRMVAFGITTWFLLQSIINIGAIMGLVPLTGVPLPFISYGGTALIMCLSSVGIMLTISRYSYGK